MKKDDKQTVNREWLPARIILAVIVTVFLTMGLIVKQPCDIDQATLWCRLHPASILQILGVVLILAGAFILSGLWKGWLTLWNDENNTKWNTVFFVFLLAGFLLTWFG